MWWVVPLKSTNRGNMKSKLQERRFTIVLRSSPLFSFSSPDFVSSKTREEKEKSVARCENNVLLCRLGRTLLSKT